MWCCSIELLLLLLLFFFLTNNPFLPYPQKRECGIFGPGMVLNSTRTTGVKLSSPHLVFATLAFGSSKYTVSYIRLLIKLSK